MATVVISKELITNVVQATKKLYEPRIAEASRMPEHWFDMVYNALVPAAHVEIMKSLPSGYFEYVSHIRITPPQVDGHIVSYIELRSAVLVPVPYSFVTSVSGLLKSSYSGVNRIDPSDPRWSQFIAEHSVWIRNKQAVLKEQQGACDRVKALMGQFRTLSPALKAWPPLWDLLPEYAKTKHKEVKDRKQKEQGERPAVDLDDLTTTITVNKILGSQQ